MRSIASASNGLGFANWECERIVEWLDELVGPCSYTQAVVLASQLGSTLQGYMGIDSEMLSHAFLRGYWRQLEA